MELSKYFTNSEIVEVMRSEIHPAAYNPRFTDDEGKKLLKQSLKRYGVVGGIVVNRQTGNTVVGGHQKIFILDNLHKYNEETKENDYGLRVEMVDIDIKTEKELNITLNNPNVGGQWDYDALRQLIPDIDYKNAGLTDADLNLIGVDFLLQTEGENQITDALDDLMFESNEQHQAEVQQRKEERIAARQAEQFSPSTPIDEDADRQAKIEHMKQVKQQVKEDAQRTAENMEAYVTLSFSDFDAKAAFCMRFGFGPYEKFIKGEVFDEMVERID